ncbi:MAG TPA: UDP-2,3-diacylglucosamine diphosphatase [Opitutaceae bacterium]|nr:UDP-2,3-diacylglucosamine diphosphatase [Opitutaceae bacterium]
MSTDPKPLKVRTVIISDVHLGTFDCKIREVNHFLKHIRCEKLILNGDIIDAWVLKKGGQWPKSHTRFIRIVLKKLEKRDTEVVYLRGNHDDMLGKVLPLEFENLRIVEEHIHPTPRGRYLVLHGDVFDTITQNFVFLAYIGDWGYRLLMRFNRLYNHWRAWRGLEYYSLSKAVKARVKSAVSHVSKFEDHIVELAKRRGCIGVMCGHIHTAADKMLGDIHYLNSGDWVESLTGIVEHFDGRFELIDFADFKKLYPLPDEGAEAAAEALELAPGPAPSPAT